MMQVPFNLKQQRVIASSLNTMVYNGFFSASKQQFMPLLEVAIKCLNSLYGRDCRRSFCSLSLWLAPAVANRPPIPASARAHEVALASIRTGEYSQAPAIGYVLILIPHVIPFEERHVSFSLSLRVCARASPCLLHLSPPLSYTICQCM